MDSYNGIQISEYRLLTHNIIFTVLLIILIFIISFWIYTTFSRKNKKDITHIKKLKEKAQNNKLAKKQLEKIARKKNRKSGHNRCDYICDFVILIICICLVVISLVWCVIPGWTDYFKKDYVTYTGEITVDIQMKNSRIELDDDTTVLGTGSFYNEDSYGTVVYSRRTKHFLGGSN